MAQMIELRMSKDDAQVIAEALELAAMQYEAQADTTDLEREATECTNKARVSTEYMFKLRRPGEDPTEAATRARFKLGEKKPFHHPLRERFSYVALSVLDLWADQVNGIVQVVERDGKNIIRLECPEDTFEYDKVEDAVDDALYTISQWLKEV